MTGTKIFNFQAETYRAMGLMSFGPIGIGFGNIMLNGFVSNDDLLRIAAMSLLCFLVGRWLIQKGCRLKEKEDMIEE